MSFSDYKKKKQELINNWTEHPEDINKRFVYDGIVANLDSEDDYNVWLNSKSKILFLVKEAFNDYEPECPTEDKKKFHLNMAKWRYLIDGFISNDSIPQYPTNEVLVGRNVGIAIVEVKKFDDDSHNSKRKDILYYAKRDSQLLQEQIELINPNIILCGGTFDAYEDGIYENEKDKITHEYYGVLENISASIYNHKKRTILNFYHPSYTKSPETLYNLLGKLFINRNKRTISD
jgi:hypothetical protein